MAIRLSLLALILAFILGLSGCDRSTATVPKEPAEVRVGYFANLTHAQAVLGVASGDFAAAVAPAKLDTRVFNAGPSLMEAMIAGEIDIAYVGPGPAIAAHAATGGDAIRIVSGAAANGVLIVARQESPAKSLADLATVHLATPQHANTQDIAARRYLRSELGRTDLSNVVAIANAEQLSLMQRGEIDAAWVPEPWASLLIKEAGARVLADEKDLWPGGQFATTVVVASRPFLEQHPDVVARFLAAHRVWTDKLAESPTAQLPALKSALFALTRKQLPEGVLDRAILNVTFTDDPLLETVQTMARWSFEVGFAKRQPKLDTLFQKQEPSGQVN